MLQQQKREFEETLKMNEHLSLRLSDTMNVSDSISWFYLYFLFYFYFYLLFLFIYIFYFIFYTLFLFYFILGSMARPSYGQDIVV